MLDKESLPHRFFGRRVTHTQLPILFLFLRVIVLPIGWWQFMSVNNKNKWKYFNGGASTLN